MPFLRGMQDQGYIKGRDIDLVYRYADGYAQRLPALAEKLVRIKPNVILAPAYGPGCRGKKCHGDDFDRHAGTRRRRAGRTSARQTSAGRCQIPISSPSRSAAQRPLDHSSNLIVVDGSRPPRRAS